jgi:cell division topological specificity factor
MTSFIDRLIGRDKRSANQAKERLKLVLIHDRTNLAPGILEEMKDEIIKVISRYVEIDPVEVKMKMEQDGREQRLVADIPIRETSRRRARS